VVSSAIVSTLTGDIGAPLIFDEVFRLWIVNCEAEPELKWTQAHFQILLLLYITLVDYPN
jgi:hypothetical protein